MEEQIIACIVLNKCLWVKSTIIYELIVSFPRPLFSAMRRKTMYFDYVSSSCIKTV